MGRPRKKERKSDELYRKEHWFAIQLKHQMHRRLSHVKKRRRGTRSEYYKEYYRKNKESILKRTQEWVEENRDKTREYKRRYKEKRKRLKEKYKRSLYRTIDNIIVEYLSYLEDRFKPSTLRQYSVNLARFRAYLLDVCRIDSVEELSKDIVLTYQNYVYWEETKKDGRKLTESQKEGRLYPLRGFLRYLFRKGYVKKNRSRFIIVQRRSQKVPKRALTPEEMARLIVVPDQKTTLAIRQRAMLEVMYSGLRINELLSLKLANIDLDTNKIEILESKEDKDRVVPLTTEAIYWVRRWLQRRDELVKGKKDPEYLFLSKRGNKLIRKCFGILLRKCAVKAGIGLDITPHDLRRATATHLAQNGAPIRMIQALLGHATLAVTTNYLRIPDERIKKEHKKTHPSNRRKLYYDYARI